MVYFVIHQLEFDFFVLILLIKSYNQTSIYLVTTLPKNTMLYFPNAKILTEA